MKKTKEEQEEQTGFEETLSGETEIEPTISEPAYLSGYRASYPAGTQFHITGDNMVFLDYDKALAHQKYCKGKLQTY